MSKKLDVSLMRVLVALAIGWLVIYAVVRGALTLLEGR